MQIRFHFRSKIKPVILVSHIGSVLYALAEEVQPPAGANTGIHAAIQLMEPIQSRNNSAREKSHFWTDRSIHCIVTQTSVPAKRTQQELLKWHGYWSALESRSSYLKGSLSLHNSQTTLPTIKMKIMLHLSSWFLFSKLQISWLHILTQFTSFLKSLATHYMPLIMNSPVSLPPMSPNSQTSCLLWQYSNIRATISRTTADLLFISSDMRDRRFSKGITILTIFQSQNWWQWEVTY